VPVVTVVRRYAVGDRPQGGMMSSNSIVPATALSRYNDAFELSSLVIGKTYLVPKPEPTEAFYWFVVVSLGDLSVAANCTSTSASALPTEVQPFVGSMDHYLYFIANNQMGYNVPQGELAATLAKIGAGNGLARLEQAIEQLGTGTLRYFSYVLAATTDTNDCPGFELISFDVPSVLTMQFKPIEVDGKTTYAPIRL